MFNECGKHIFTVRSGKQTSPSIIHWISPNLLIRSYFPLLCHALLVYWFSFHGFVMGPSIQHPEPFQEPSFKWTCALFSNHCGAAATLAKYLFMKSDSCSTQDFPSRFEQIPALRARIASPNSANQIFLHWVCSCIFQRSVVWDLEHHDKTIHSSGGEFLSQPPARPFWWRVLYATRCRDHCAKVDSSWAVHSGNLT